jgi:hypothetical protein
MANEELGRLVPVIWVGLDDVPIMFANQFVIQGAGSELTLTIGQLAPPMLLGSEDERRQQAEAISYIPVKPLSRVSLTTERLAELIDVLSQHQEQMQGPQSAPRGK